MGSYENDELKEISHKNLVELAKFYGVSTDYLLCLTENRNHPDTGLTELHLSDDMVELLKSGRINNRLLCEIATHEDFLTLMTDSAPDGSNAMKLIKDAKKALAVPGSYLDVFTALMCTQLQIRYEKLSEQGCTVLKNVMKKTPAYKDSPLSRMKRR